MVLCIYGEAGQANGRAGLGGQVDSGQVRPPLAVQSSKGRVFPGLQGLGGRNLKSVHLTAETRVVTGWTWTGFPPPKGGMEQPSSPLQGGLARSGSARPRVSGPSGRQLPIRATVTPGFHRSQGPSRGPPIRLPATAQRSRSAWLLTTRPIRPFHGVSPGPGGAFALPLREIH